MTLALSSLVKNHGDINMDKERIKGTGQKIKGNIKEAAGKMTGDKSLEIEGKADKFEGEVRNVVGKAKDAVRDAVKDAEHRKN